MGSRDVVKNHRAHGESNLNKPINRMVHINRPGQLLRILLQGPRVVIKYTFWDIKSGAALTHHIVRVHDLSLNMYGAGR